MKFPMRDLFYAYWLRDRIGSGQIVRNTIWNSVPTCHPVRDGDEGVPSDGGLNAQRRAELRSVQSCAESHSVYDRLFQNAERGAPTAGAKLDINLRSSLATSGQGATPGPGGTLNVSNPYDGNPQQRGRRKSIRSSRELPRSSASSTNGGSTRQGVRPLSSQQYSVQSGTTTPGFLLPPLPHSIQ